MKQAIEERFILDVLKSYTPVDSYYKLIKKTDDDPEFDTKKVRKSFVSMLKATTMPSDSRPRLWLIISTSKY